MKSELQCQLRELPGDLKWSGSSGEEHGRHPPASSRTGQEPWERKQPPLERAAGKGRPRGE